MNCKELKRLTTDNPKRNFEILMNYAYAKNNRTHLSYAGGKNDVDLCEYVSDLAKAKGYNFSPEFIMEDGLFHNCDDDFAILYYCAVQAAELRARLKLYEDKLENGTLIELPCKVGDTVYVIYDKYVTTAKVLAIYIDQIGGMFDLRIKTNDETATGFKTVIDTNNYTFENVFFTKEEAEKALEGLK